MIRTTHALTLIVLVTVAAPGFAQQTWPTTKIWDSGPTERRIDLVVMGDGYQSNEIPLFHTHVQSFMSYWFNSEPFDRYKNMINVWRVDVASVDSGSDKPAQCFNNPVMRDTELNTSYCIQGVKRCVQPTGPVAQMTALLNVPEYDEILVLVNDGEYGGCAGAIACSTGVHSAASDVAVHELGHSIFGLADEYGGSGTYTGGQFSQVNASNQDGATMAAQMSKWHYWMGMEGISAFEGCHYHDFGAWRPRGNCKMRSLYQTFCAVCREESADICWSAVTGLDIATPEVGGGVLPVTPITAEVPVPDGTSLTTEWYVDGVLVGPGTQTVMGTVAQLGFDPTPTIGASTANHVVELKVYDGSPWRPAHGGVVVLPTTTWTMSNTVYDLEMQGLVVIDLPARRGELFRVQTTLTNNGPAASQAFDLLIRVRTVNNVVAPLDAAAVTVGPLAAGATDVRVIDCRLPAVTSVPVGSISLEAVIDPNGQNAESDETNNSVTAPTPPVDTTPTLSSNTALANWSIPRVITADVDAGPGHAQEQYFVFVSAVPPPPGGFDLGPFVGTIAFAPDQLTEMVLSGAIGPPVFVDFVGTLDAAGTATATFDKPALFGIPATPLFFNYLTFGVDPTSGSTVVPIVGNLTTVLFLP